MSLIKKGFVLSILLPALSFAGFLFSSPASAQITNFNQAILPVRYVYLNNQGSIEKIWSNVSEKDNLYVVKCFDAKSQKEINISDNILSSYQVAISQSQLISGTIVPNPMKNYNFSENKFNLAIDFIHSGSSLEEVHTYT